MLSLFSCRRVAVWSEPRGGARWGTSDRGNAGEAEHPNVLRRGERASVWRSRDPTDLSWRRVAGYVGVVQASKLDEQVGEGVALHE